eukprot:1111847-Rhodomonas_salina.2
MRAMKRLMLRSCGPGNLCRGVLACRALVPRQRWRGRARGKGCWLLAAGRVRICDTADLETPFSTTF